MNELSLPEDGDQALYERIWYANRDDRLFVGVDLRLFNRTGSPTYSQADNALPLVATLSCVASAWMLGGWIWGLAILGSGVILTMTTFNVWVMHRLRRRTMAMALSGLDGWLQLWQFGGLSLRLPEETEDAVTAPRGDWRDFARRRLAVAEV
tara:strand:+ start:1537 stop:1992 length:456 start_codon:yes stop_codon:yes gene_type:complete